MSLNTHCEARTFRGKTWETGELTATMSGTPQGVIEMLFQNIARYDQELATKTLFSLHEAVAYENQIRIDKEQQ